MLTTGIDRYLDKHIRFMLEYGTIPDTEGSTRHRDAADVLDIYPFRAPHAFSKRARPV